VLQPVAVLDHPDRVVAPQLHPAQHDILAAVRVDDVEAREQRFGAGRAHIDKDEPAIFRHRVGGLPQIHRLAELLGFARHVDALALRIIEPAVIETTKPPIFDSAIAQIGPPVRTVQPQQTRASLIVTEKHEIFAQNPHRQGCFVLRQLLGQCYRLPVSPQ